MVVEQTLRTGRLVDMCRGANVPKVHGQPTRTRLVHRTSKTDRQDADLLAQLSTTGQLRTVHVQWRILRGKGIKNIYGIAHVSIPWNGG